MERKRSSRRALIITVVVLILLLSAATGVLVNMGFLKPTRVVVITSEKPAPEQPQTDYAAASSWKVFVDDARAKCEKEGPNCTVDYTALHDYGKGAYGVMIIGYRDSEYVTDLYRYDPSTKDWEPAPKRQHMDGYEAIDSADTAQKWGVPRETIEGWTDEAEKAVTKIYADRNKSREQEH